MLECLAHLSRDVYGQALVLRKEHTYLRVLIVRSIHLFSVLRCWWMVDGKKVNVRKSVRGTMFCLDCH